MCLNCATAGHERRRFVRGMTLLERRRDTLRSAGADDAAVATRAYTRPMSVDAARTRFRAEADMLGPLEEFATGLTRGASVFFEVASTAGVTDLVSLPLYDDIVEQRSTMSALVEPVLVRVMLATSTSRTPLDHPDEPPSRHEGLPREAPRRRTHRREIRRCIKRYLARHLYRTVNAVSEHAPAAT